MDETIDAEHRATVSLRGRVATCLSRRRAFRAAQRSLLSSVAFSDDERQVLEHVSLHVHRADGMYVAGQEAHYLSVGLSALRCVRRALRAGSKQAPLETVLDFPCGYGRVLRFLRVANPDAHLAGADLDQAAVAFCRRAFRVQPLTSSSDFDALSYSQKFDLIWCGSLLTHLDERAAEALLRFFRRHVSDRGMCVFSTHGRGLVERLRAGSSTYGLAVGAQRQLLADLDAVSYAYTETGHRPGYGISVVTHDHMSTLAAGAGSWNEVLFQERGWDDHQDVYAWVPAG